MNHTLPQRDFNPDISSNQSHRSASSARESTHVRVHNPEPRSDRLRDAVDAIRERDRLIDGILATAQDPVEARRIYLACRLAEIAWVKSKRLCRQGLAEYGIHTNEFGIVRCANGE